MNNYIDENLLPKHSKPKDMLYIYFICQLVHQALSSSGTLVTKHTSKLW